MNEKSEEVKISEPSPEMDKLPEEAKNRELLLSEFNLLPEVLREWTFGGGLVKVRLYRGKGNIDVMRPDVIRADLKYVIESQGHIPVEFEPADFITKFGARARRKFVSAFASVIGDTSVTEEVSNHMIEFQTERGRISEKYRIGKPQMREVRSPILRGYERSL